MPLDRLYAQWQPLNHEVYNIVVVFVLVMSCLSGKKDAFLAQTVDVLVPAVASPRLDLFSLLFSGAVVVARPVFDAVAVGHTVNAGGVTTSAESAAATDASGETLRR